MVAYVGSLGERLQGLGNRCAEDHTPGGVDIYEHWRLTDLETAHKECICPEVHLSFPGNAPLRRMTWGPWWHLGTTLESKAQPLLSCGSGVCERR